MTSSPFTVVVVSYGSHALIADTLTRTLEHAPGARAVVVDNATTADERRAVQELATARGWSLVLPDTNLGFGGGMNRGVRRAFDEGAERVLLLNPDAYVVPGGLDLLGAALDREPMTMVAPVIRRPDGSRFSGGLTRLLLRDGTMRGASRYDAAVDGEAVEWLSGACLALTRELWEAAGGFDERYFLYWEDVDLSRRVLGAGGRLGVVPDAAAVHDEGGTHDDRPGAGRAKSATYLYHNARNRLLYAAVWLDEPTRRRWGRTTPRATWALLRQGGRRPLVTSLEPWVAVVRGVRDGRRLARRVRGGTAGGSGVGAATPERVHD